MTANVLDALERQGHRMVIPAPSVPQTFVIAICDDEDLEAPGESNELLDVVGMALGIVYLGSNGRESRRRITLRSLVTQGGILSLNAYCHEREAIRQFRADRIKEMVILNTGEVIDNAGAFLDSLSGRDPTAEAILGCRHELQVLTFLARCDGTLHPDEQAVIADFVISTAHSPADIDEHRVQKHVSALYPDTLTFFRSLRAIRFSGGPQMRELSRYMKRVIDADGALHEHEFQFVLQAQGELPSR